MVRFVLRRGPFCPETWSVLSGPFCPWSVCPSTGGGGGGGGGGLDNSSEIIFIFFFHFFYHSKNIMLRPFFRVILARQF